MNKRICRGVFRNVPAWMAAIQKYLDNYQENVKISRWVTMVDRPGAKIAKCHNILN